MSLLQFFLQMGVCVYMRGGDGEGACAFSQHRLDLLHFLLLQPLGEDGALARRHRVVFVLLGDGVEEAAVLRLVLFLFGASLVPLNAVPAVQEVAQRLRSKGKGRRHQEEKSTHQEGHVVRLCGVVNGARKRRT